MAAYYTCNEFCLFKWKFPLVGRVVERENIWDHTISHMQSLYHPRWYTNCQVLEILLNYYLPNMKQTKPALHILLQMLQKLRLGASFYTQIPDGTYKPTVNYIADVVFKPYKNVCWYNKWPLFTTGRQNKWKRCKVLQLALKMFG